MHGLPLDVALDKALSDAGMAPSSHNCQPWAVSLSKTTDKLNLCIDSTEKIYIIFSLDLLQAIHSLDSHRLEMNISCGMHTFIFTTSMLGSGWKLDPVQMNSDIDCGLSHLIQTLPESLSPIMAYVVRPGTFESMRPELCQRMLSWSQKRRTNRSPYLDQGPATDQLKSIVSESQNAFTKISKRQAGTLVTFSDSTQKSLQISQFIRKYGAKDFSHKKAWAETYRYIQFHHHKTPIRRGFPITQLLGPMSWAQRSVLKIGLSPTVMSQFPFFKISTLLAKGLADLSRTTKHFIFISTDESEISNHQQEFLIGQEIMSLWLSLTGHKLTLHPISFLIQHPDLRKKFEAEHQIKGRLIFFARLGYPTLEFDSAPKIISGIESGSSHLDQLH